MSKRTQLPQSRRGEPSRSQSDVVRNLPVQREAGYAQDLPVTPENKQGAKVATSLRSGLEDGVAMGRDARMSARPHSASMSTSPENHGLGGNVSPLPEVQGKDIASVRRGVVQATVTMTSTVKQKR